MEIKKIGIAGTAWDFITSLIPIFIVVLFIRTFIAQPFIVSGESMYPTLQDKNYLIIDELSYRFTEPTHGDVIVMRYPGDPKRFFIKRIIGLPGDTISFVNGKVLLSKNGNPPQILNEPYYTGMTIAENKSTVTLGVDEYFVMGDNRMYSSDSRAWGVLPKKNIIGRAFLRLYPISKIDIMPGSIKKFTEPS